MNGYFVQKELLEKLDQLSYLTEILHGLEERPEELPEGEVEEMQQTCRDTIESLGFELEDMAEQIAGDVRNAEMEAKAYKAEADIWKNKQYKAERRAKNEKQLLMYLMKKNDKTKMAAGKFNLTIANNGGKTPIKYNVLNMEDLPSKFRTKQVIYKADDIAIREYLDSGKTSKYFQYGERGQSLRIR